MSAHTDSSLKNHFLVAMPTQAGGYFDQSLTYLCEHSAEGAMGLIVNRSTDRKVTDLLRELSFVAQSDQVHQAPLLDGGPVGQQQAFVLHSADCEFTHSLPLAENAMLSASPDVLRSIAAGQGPKDYLVVLGYAGWGPGQLEHELAAHAWVSFRADTQLMFTTPVAERLKTLTQAAGVDVNLMAGQVGHD